MNAQSVSRHKVTFWLMAILATGVGAIAAAPYLPCSAEHFNNATLRYAYASRLQFVSLFVHIFTGVIALMIGPAQFAPGLRQRHTILHRWIGRIYLFAVVSSAVCAFIIAPGMISGLVGEFGLIFLAILWLWTAWNALKNIREGNVRLHCEWMIRNYALTFAAVTLRLWLLLLITAQLPLLESKYAGNFNTLFVEAYRVVMWLSWVPNLIFAEYLVQKHRDSNLSNNVEHITQPSEL